MDALKAADPEMVPEHLSAENVVDVDNDVIATAPVVTGKHQQESEIEDECDNVTNNYVAPERPSRSEVESALYILKNYVLSSTTGDKMQRVILKFVFKGMFSLV